MRRRLRPPLKSVAALRVTYTSVAVARRSSSSQDLFVNCMHRNRPPRPLSPQPPLDTHRQDADLVGAEFLGQAFFDAKLLLDELQHNWALDLTDHQVGAGGGGGGEPARQPLEPCPNLGVRKAVVKTGQ